MDELFPIGVGILLGILFSLRLESARADLAQGPASCGRWRVCHDCERGIRGELGIPDRGYRRGRAGRLDILCRLLLSAAQDAGAQTAAGIALPPAAAFRAQSYPRPPAGLRLTYLPGRRQAALRRQRHELLQPVDVVVAVDEVGVGDQAPVQRDGGLDAADHDIPRARGAAASGTRCGSAPWTISLAIRLS